MRSSVTPPTAWTQNVAATVEELAGELGAAVWVPAQWPATVAGPEILVMQSPGTDRGRDGYLLCGTDVDGRLLIVHGDRRLPGGHLAATLTVVPGERFEML